MDEPPGTADARQGRPAASPAPTRMRHWILAALCSLAFLTYLDRICIMRVQGSIETDLRFGELTLKDEAWLAERGLDQDADARARLSRDRATQRMSWVFSAFVAGYVLFETPGGWMGDVWGARAVILRIVIWWSAFTAMTGGVQWFASLFSPNPGPGLLLGLMVTARFLFGLGEAGAYPNIARALGRWFPLRERATAQSFIWFSSRLGGAAAPAVVAALMAIAGSWQAAFVVLGVVGVVWAVGFHQWYRDRPEEMRGVNPAECELIRGGVAVDGSVYDDRTTLKVPWRELFSPNLLALYVAAFCVSFSFYFYITFLPKYLKEHLHIDYGSSQWLTGLPLLLGSAACLAGGRFSDYVTARTGLLRWGRRLPPLIGWSAAGFCALTVSQIQSPWVIVALICVAFACQDLGVPCMWSIPADVGGRYAGTVGGCMNTSGAVGGMLSPLLAARVSSTHGWEAAFVMFGVVYLIGALAWLFIDAGRGLKQPEPSQINPAIAPAP